MLEVVFLSEKNNYPKFAKKKLIKLLIKSIFTCDRISYFCCNICTWNVSVIHKVVYLGNSYELFGSIFEPKA